MPRGIDPRFYWVSVMDALRITCDRSWSPSCKSSQDKGGLGVRFEDGCVDREGESDAFGSGVRILGIEC